MNSIRAFFASRTGRLLEHDALLAAAAGVTAWQAAGSDWTWGAFTAAGVVAGKAFLRLVLPVPGTPTTKPVHRRLKLLPPPSGRKGGALPSPRDDRDHVAKLATRIPSSLNYGAGITWGMLLNDRIGDCYPAALLHAIQILTGYTPTDSDALAIYEQVTGYDPSRTDANGNNPTDRGTVGRQLYAWAKKQGLIDSYATVPIDVKSVKAAITAHRHALCEWALPAGAENEGDRWTMPHCGRQAGSWGGHATVQDGYTSADTDNVTWGEQGTVTASFSAAYLQAAWVISCKLTAQQVAAIMARVRAA